jgi:hypothetical protein
MAGDDAKDPMYSVPYVPSPNESSEIHTGTPVLREKSKLPDGVASTGLKLSVSYGATTSTWNCPMLGSTVREPKPPQTDAIPCCSHKVNWKVPCA